MHSRQNVESGNGLSSVKAVFLCEAAVNGSRTVDRKGDDRQTALPATGPAKGGIPGSGGCAEPQRCFKVRESSGQGAVLRACGEWVQMDSREAAKGLCRHSALVALCPGASLTSSRCAGFLIISAVFIFCNLCRETADFQGFRAINSAPSVIFQLMPQTRSASTSG